MKTFTFPALSLSILLFSTTTNAQNTFQDSFAGNRFVDITTMAATEDGKHTT